MLWDLFCEVIDNFGDIGVCWRLSRDLVARGEQVRLWINDPAALRWMAPELHWHTPCAPGPQQEGVQALPGPALAQSGALSVHAWQQAHSCPPNEVGDVLIEAFGCRPPEPFIQRLACAAQQRQCPPVWINLEYLSAEDYVERSHGLPSPVTCGAGQGLRKYFYYPGLTSHTGGLLREPGLEGQREAFLRDERAGWLQSLGVRPAAPDHLVSVFCYANAPLGALLDELASANAIAPHAHIWVLLTPGAATTLAQTWLRQRASERSAQSAPAAEAPQPQLISPPLKWRPEASPVVQAGALRLVALPYLSQADFDRLLWSCDLNIVRGEDSAVRALWARRPHLWQLYPQQDHAHLAKSAAFAHRWMAAWPAALRERVQAWQAFINGACAERPSATLPVYWVQASDAWGPASANSATELAQQADLVTRLTQFVAAKR